VLTSTTRVIVWCGRRTRSWSSATVLPPSSTRRAECGPVQHPVTHPLLPEVHQSPEDPQTVDRTAACGRARVAVVAHHHPYLSTPPGTTPAAQVATTAGVRGTPATTGAAPGSRSRRAEPTRRRAGRPTGLQLVEHGRRGGPRHIVDDPCQKIPASTRRPSGWRCRTYQLGVGSARSNGSAKAAAPPESLARLVFDLVAARLDLIDQAEAQVATVPITRHDLHGERNYTIPYPHEPTSSSTKTSRETSPSVLRTAIGDRGHCVPIWKPLGWPTCQK
jgi:hypothetical protein